MSDVSTIPAAIDGLLAAAAAAIGATVSVVDGPPLQWNPLKLPDPGGPSASKVLLVGATPNGDSSADGVEDFNAAGNVSRDERFSIHCTAWSGAAGGTAKNRRDDAFAVVAAVERALRTDGTLGGAVLYAGPVSVIRHQSRQTEGGPDCVVEFDVPVRSYLS